MWVPGDASADLKVTVKGLKDVKQHAVPGGHLVVAKVAAAGEYSLKI